MSIISQITTAVPKHSLSQEEFTNYYSSLSEDESVKRKIRILGAKSGIVKRHCVEPRLSKLLKLNIAEKMSLYQNSARELAKEAVGKLDEVQNNAELITDIIIVSCTGMQAPGLEFDLISEFKLNTTIRRYNINFMGCYAAITAIRLADEICKSPNRKVLILSIELCTLHFRQDFHSDYLMSNSLFADGAAALIVSSSADKGLEILDFESRVIPESKTEMSWKISPDGFLMTLSNEIPHFIKSLFAHESLFNKNLSDLNWVIHPGGRQILDAIQDELQLDIEQLESSRHILKNFGNMSSTTVLFILQNQLLNQNKRLNKETVVCAFGPGLTFESMLVNEI